MSVVVWDGTSLAADRQSIINDMRSTASKICRLPGALGAWVGTHSQGLLLIDWYRDGADPAQWPAFQKDKEEWTRLIIVNNKGLVWEYECEPVKILLEDPYMAWGSGAQYAMGALAMGASAKQAVEIANRFCVTCGVGVDVMTPGG